MNKYNKLDKIKKKKKKLLKKKLKEYNIDICEWIQHSYRCENKVNFRYRKNRPKHINQEILNNDMKKPFYKQLFFMKC